MSTGQVMFCGKGVKAGWLIPFVDRRVGGAQIKLVTARDGWLVGV